MQNKLKTLVIRGQRGDTIVEVMIVLAVLGLAIGISYATANRSLQNTRQAQENSQASELLESQVEQLRASTDPTLYTNPPTTTFCMIDGTVTPIDGSHPCKFNQSGSASCGSTEPFCYTVTVSRCDVVSITCSAPGTFTATATWDDVSGNGTDTVTADYRMPQLPAGALGWSDTAPSCPVGYGGTYPNCTCPAGDTGVYPACIPPPSNPTGSVTVAATGPSKISPTGPYPNENSYTIPITITGGTPGDKITLVAGSKNTSYDDWNAFTFDSNGNVSGTMTGHCSSTGTWTIFTTGKKYGNADGSWKNTGVQVCP